jgi:hypothetical protein
MADSIACKNDIQQRRRVQMRFRASETLFSRSRVAEAKVVSCQKIQSTIPPKSSPNVNVKNPQNATQMPAIHGPVFVFVIRAFVSSKFHSSKSSYSMNPG